MKLLSLSSIHLKAKLLTKGSFKISFVEVAKCDGGIKIKYCRKCFHNLISSVQLIVLVNHHTSPPKQNLSHSLIRSKQIT